MYSKRHSYEEMEFCSGITGLPIAIVVYLIGITKACTTRRPLVVQGNKRSKDVTGVPVAVITIVAWLMPREQIRRASRQTEPR